MPPKEENLHPDTLPYVYNEMSPEERKAFELSMSQDEALKSQVTVVTAELADIRANTTAQAVPPMPTYITHNILAAATRQADSLRYGDAPAAASASPASALTLWLARAFRPAASIAFSAVLVFSVALFYNQQRARDTFETVASVDLSQVKMRKVDDPRPDQELLRESLRQRLADPNVLNLNVQQVGLQSAKNSGAPTVESLLTPRQRAATDQHKLALRLLQEGNPEKAAATYAAIVATYPDYMALPGVYFENAKVLLGLKQYQSARSYFEKTIEARPHMRHNIQPYLDQIDAALVQPAASH